jgi:hypothetical protein
MTDLASRLDDLGASLVFPPTPDLAERVLARLARRRRRRRALVLAAAALLAALAAVLATSPGARSALLRAVGIGDVRIERVGELPEVAVERRPVFGREMTLAEARRRAGFALALPTLEGLEEPDVVYFRGYPEGGTVTLLYGSRDEPRLALSQWSGTTIEPVATKLVPPGTTIDYVNVRGAVGIWLAGAPHVFFAHDRRGRPFGETVYLAGSVLVWERGSVAYRLEAAVSREDAVAIAASVP